MKLTKRQLKQIVKEEKAKLVSEANPDGTISADEEELEEELVFLKHVILIREHVEHQHGEIETILLEHLIE